MALIAKSGIQKYWLALFLCSVSFGLAAQSARRLYLLNLDAKYDSVSNAPHLVDSGAIDFNFIFHQDSAKLYYIVASGEKNAITSLNHDTNERKKIWEGNPGISMLQLTADGKSLSALQSKPNEKQDLVKFSFGGGEGVILEGIRFQNHLWLDDNSLLYIDRGNPNALHLFTIRPRKDIELARNVGISLTSAGDPRRFLFIHKLSVDTWSIKEISNDGNIRIIAETIPESELITTDDHGNLYTASENILFRADKQKAWERVYQFSASEKIINIQTNKNGNKIAVLVENN